ncbi:MAG: hypothetical protein CMJ51_03025 [Planctomycetaceae bacterium]|nr:hypothetical protein [Planctomycetaceae bacterium]
MTSQDDKTIMRSLGEFVGHVVKGIRTDPAAKAETTEVRRTIETEERERVILRRTVIEEVEVRDSDLPPSKPS